MEACCHSIQQSLFLEEQWLYHYRDISDNVWNIQKESRPRQHRHRSSEKESGGHILGSRQCLGFVSELNVRTNLYLGQPPPTVARLCWADCLQNIDCNTTLLLSVNSTLTFYEHFLRIICYAVNIENERVLIMIMKWTCFILLKQQACVKYN